MAEYAEGKASEQAVRTLGGAMAKSQTSDINELQAILTRLGSS